MTRLCAVSLLAVFVGASVSAAAETSPQAIDLGAFKLIPTLDVTAKHDDNLYSSATNVKDSYITVVAPELQFVTGVGTAATAITYQGAYGLYEYDSNDDYVDHLLSFDYKLNQRKGMFSFTAQMDRGHDARGEGSSEGIAFTRERPDRYLLKGLSTTIGFGSDNSRVGVSVDFTGSALDYLNNRSETKYRDRNTRDLAGRIFMRATPDFRVFGEYDHRNFDYAIAQLAGGSIDSEEDSVSLGLVWEITGKTQGDVKVGNTKKKFDNAALTDGDMRSWAATVTWSPKTYSTLILSTSSQPRETNGTGTYIEARSTSLTWAHQWLERLSSNVYVRNGRSEYSGDTRSDDLRGYGASINYDMRRWVSLRFFADQSRRNSSVGIYDFDKNVWGLTVDLSL